MSLTNVIRNVFNIRKERSVPAAGPMPPIGSNIVRERLRIRLKYPITLEQWEFFSRNGWRTVDMRKDRRRYMSVPDKILVKLLDRSGAERDDLHSRLIKVEMKKTTSRKKTDGDRRAATSGKAPKSAPATLQAENAA